MSEHVEVFKIKEVERVEGLDNLGLVRFYDYQALVPLADFKAGDLATYIPPDFIVPDAPEYAFLQGHNRIKAKRLRKVWSQGLVVTAPRGSKVGDDVTELMGITKYVPKRNKQDSANFGNHKGKKWFKYSSFIEGPPISGPYYDIESWFRYGDIFKEGEMVLVTEKIHGTNARFTWQEGKLWVASRSGYRRNHKEKLSLFDKFKLVWSYGWKGLRKWEPEHLIYWEAVEQNPWIIELCRLNPGVVFYGEIFGDVQDLTYGAKSGEYFIRLFDAFKEGKFLDDNYLVSYVQKLDSHDSLDLVVPTIYYGPYSKDTIQECISGPSRLENANHLREGIVIKPLTERWDPHFGRVILKAVSPEYLARQV